ncbi:MAG: sensor histidine kinase [Proteobacteria bacterium]|nr:sensor histidine kinase [Pseudomonadota bacterium]
MAAAGRKTAKRRAPGGRDALAQARAEHQRLEAELRATIAAQDQRFRTLTHRLKNNLQLVISILSLRLSAVREPARRAELEDMLAKIHAVALIQKQLHDGGRLLALDFDAFLRELAASVPRPPGGAAPRVVLELVPVKLGIERAMPLGLIANELIALAAAGAADAPITVSLAAHDGKVVLAIGRAGLVLPDEPGRPDYGLALVRALARQAHAELAIDGASVRLTFDAEPAA